MTIKLINPPYFGEEIPLNEGEIHTTVACPIENSEYCLESSDNEVWISVNGKTVRLMGSYGDYKIETLDTQQEQFDFANSLSGTNITKNVRKLFLTNKYKDAFKVLEMSLKTDLSAKKKKELFYDILLGNKHFVNKDKNTIELIDFEDIVYKDYLKKFMSQFLHFENGVYLPKYFVNDYGHFDSGHNISFSIDTNELGRRASYYCRKKTDIVANVFYERFNHNVIFEKINLDKKLFEFAVQTPQESINNIQVIEKTTYLECRGFSFDLQKKGMDYERAEIVSPYDLEHEEEERLEELKNQISNIEYEVKTKANNFLGFKDIVVYGETYKVPFAPFLLWQSMAYGRLHELIPTLEKGYGEPASPRNLKQKGDSKYHNDWVIGSGMDHEKYYEIYRDKDSGLDDEINRLFGDFLGDIDTNVQIMNLKKEENDIIFVQPKPKFTSEVVDGDCILIERGSEKDIEDILTITESGNGVVLTENFTEVAHIVNNAVELDFSMFNINALSQTLRHLPEETIYTIDTKLNVFTRFISKGKTLSNLKEGNGKAHTLAHLRNNGILTLDGIYLDDIENLTLNLKFNEDNPLTFIVRSSGEEEGGSIKASGIFKSIKVTTEEELKNAIKEVWDSFSSKIAQTYLKRLGKTVEDIKPGILIQPFIKAEKSFVMKQKDGKTIISVFEGDCENIVNGNDNVQSETFDLNEEMIYTDLKEVTKVYKSIQNILKTDNIECEFIEKDGKIYTLQAMKI